jgi:hypothetical protein
MDNRKQNHSQYNKIPTEVWSSRTAELEEFNADHQAASFVPRQTTTRISNES